MATLDDLPLDPERGDFMPPPSAPSSPGPRIALTVLAVAALIAAGVGYLWYRPKAAPTQPAAATAPATAPSEVASPAVVPVLPALGEMDPVIREMVGTLANHPLLLKWLATDDLTGAIATAIDRLANGRSPARDLAVLRPEAPFTVRRRGGTMTADDASVRRYDPIVAVVSAVDPVKLAGVFTTLKPRLAEAYTRQGHPEGGFDDAVRRAIEVIVTTPDVPADAQLVPGVGGYVYVDPRWQALPPAQKHLLRMGPENVTRVRDAARQFAAALTQRGLTP